MTESHRDEIAKLEALFSANPDGRIFTHLAEAYRKVGELARARETVERGLQRYDSYASAHVVHGRVLSDLGDAVGAERAFRRVLELDPENRVALRALGDLAREAGRAGEALEFYRTLLVLDPNDEAVEELARVAEAEALTSSPVAEPDAVETTGVEGWEPGATGWDDAADAALEVPDTGALLDAGDDDEGFAPLDLSDGIALDDVALEGAYDAESDAEPLAELDDADEGDDDDALDLAVYGLVAPEVAAASVAADLEARDRERRNRESLEGERGVEQGAPRNAAARALNDLLGGDTFDEDEGPANGVGPVLTETMAELYARQGLHEQAAAVYRELLRERPDDERLRSRLAELEWDVADEEPEAASALHDPGDDSSADGDTFSAEFDDELDNDELDGDALDGFVAADSAWDPEPVEHAADPADAMLEDLEAVGLTFDDDLADEPVEELVLDAAEALEPEAFAGIDAAADDAADDEAAPAPPEFGDVLAAGTNGEDASWLHDAQDELDAALYGADEDELSDPADGMLFLSAEEMTADDEADTASLDFADADEADDVLGLSETDVVATNATGEPYEEAAGVPEQSIGEFLRRLVRYEVRVPGDVDAAEEASDVLLLDESDAVAEHDEFDLLFGSSAPEPESEAEPEPEAASLPEAAGDAAADAGVAEDGAEEDLEMFRTWLQNLKR